MASRARCSARRQPAAHRHFCRCRAGAPRPHRAARTGQGRGVAGVGLSRGGGHEAAQGGGHGGAPCARAGRPLRAVAVRSGEGSRAGACGGQATSERSGARGARGAGRRADHRVRRGPRHGEQVRRQRAAMAGARGGDAPAASARRRPRGTAARALSARRACGAAGDARLRQARRVARRVAVRALPDRVVVAAWSPYRRGTVAGRGPALGEPGARAGRVAASVGAARRTAHRLRTSAGCRTAARDDARLCAECGP